MASLFLVPGFASSVINVGRTRQDRSTSRYNLAQLRELENDVPAAVVAYRQAINLDEANFEARYGLSSLLLISAPTDTKALDEAAAVAEAGWNSYIDYKFCHGKQDLTDDQVFQPSWHCFALKTTDAGARLQRNDTAKGDIPAEIETLARQAVSLAEANDQFRSRPGYYTAEAYYYLARVTAPNTEPDVLCQIIRNYDNSNPRHLPWAEYARQQLPEGHICQPPS